VGRAAAGAFLFVFLCFFLFALLALVFFNEPRAVAALGVRSPGVSASPLFLLAFTIGLPLPPLPRHPPN
jgi:hypothetical protein